MWIVTLLIFIFILSIIVLVHELGHFFWAKKFGVHIDEFSIGMGPKVWGKKGKDEIEQKIDKIHAKCDGMRGKAWVSFLM